MNRRIVNQRVDGIERANELLEISKKRSLTGDEIEELKKCHTGYGGITNHGNSFFTPEVVTDFMRDMTQLSNGMKVLEFSCGSGAFLDSLYKKNPNLDITGIELNYDLARLAALCYPKANIIQGDALQYLSQFENSFDLIIGNPPYGKSQKVDGFVMAKGKLEEYFLEMAVRCLKPGGEALLLLPDGILSNNASMGIRKWLIEQCYYRATVSLPQETFYFAGTCCKTSVVYFKKKFVGNEVENYFVFMAICKNIGWDGRGKETGECDLPEILKEFGKIKELQDAAFTIQRESA